ncbi:hypothetical protein QQS21_012545 [Conoideocrella luteorostrata]|uniref:N-acetyltransferase domain-containing protein n=1 Tax=Conoideocrella luteorostrata TaxID=1105319 RepID=A0AAJ0CDU1_9HYPO|nr:hypothetical protein QQS21_012545 [Conoideocrella luteorostrata]
MSLASRPAVFVFIPLALVLIWATFSIPPASQPPAPLVPAGAMDLKLEDATVEDIPGIVDVYLAAFTDRFTAHLFPDRTDLPRWLADDYKKDMTTNHLTRFYKVTDVSVGKIVAFAQWEIPDRQAVPAGTAIKAKGKKDWPEGANAEFCDWFFGTLAKKRREIMGDTPFFLLRMMATLPEYQRHGIGSSLIRKGLQQANDQDTVSYVEGSPAGTPLYAHFGWVAKDKVPVLDGTWMITCMVRDPQPLPAMPKSHQVKEMK